MGNQLELRIVHTDIREARADIIALKFADRLHGADSAVARALGFSERLGAGEHVFLAGSRLPAQEAFFLGVGPLRQFRYEEIQNFGKSTVERISTDRPLAKSIALTIHGPGYGLDEKDSFYSLVSGLVSARMPSNSQLQSVAIVERSADRVDRLKLLLSEIQPLEGQSQVFRDGAPPKASNVVSIRDYGAVSESKPKLFVAMPFDDQYLDEYEIAFTEAAHANEFLCERLDLESFVGDVVMEIKSRIFASNGIIALLNDHNPNVFLEVGFAMAHDKPVILTIKKGMTVPFDVRGHRYVEYARIGELREKLTHEIDKLKKSGVLARGGG